MSPNKVFVPFESSGAKDISSNLTSNIRQSCWSPLPSLLSKIEKLSEIFQKERGRGGGGHQKLERVQSLHTVPYSYSEKFSGQQRKLHAGSTDPWMFQTFYFGAGQRKELVSVIKKSWHVCNKFSSELVFEKIRLKIEILSILKFGSNSEFLSKL